MQSSETSADFKVAAAEFGARHRPDLMNPHMTAHPLHPQCWPAYRPCPTRMQLITGLGEEGVNKRAMAGGNQGGRKRSLAKLDSCFFFDIKMWGIFFFQRPAFSWDFSKAKRSNPEMTKRVILAPNPEMECQAGLHLSKVVKPKGSQQARAGVYSRLTVPCMVMDMNLQQPMKSSTPTTTTCTSCPTGMARIPLLRH